jgi:hypothetical protein
MPSKIEKKKKKKIIYLKINKCVFFFKVCATGARGILLLLFPCGSIIFFFTELSGIVSSAIMSARVRNIPTTDGRKNHTFYHLFIYTFLFKKIFERHLKIDPAAVQSKENLI